LSTKGSKALAWLLIVLLSASFGEFASAQQPPEHREESEPQEERDYSLTFGRTVAMPGQPAAVSVFFTRRAGIPNVGNLKLRLTFPTARLSFDRSEAAYLARRAGVELQTIQGGSGDEGTLDLTFTLSAESDREFPNGQIAYVHFTVAEQALKGGFSLRPELWIENKPAVGSDLSVRIADARVIISDTPILVGCFFFTH
jgi:hypothetical protein